MRISLPYRTTLKSAFDEAFDGTSTKKLAVGPAIIGIVMLTALPVVGVAVSVSLPKDPGVAVVKFPGVKTVLEPELGLMVALVTLPLLQVTLCRSMTLP